ncbi:hypothetical protein DYB37_005089 [Aphanomyces astaci]|uniref:Uncharacterized protein n=1 Tax=Aphanomyces astaci TaxID=112090 RepID=A0A418EE05_APHAT|nr:hypothetical protein DYB37_005089 [Aphanomyces astaci]
MSDDMMSAIKMFMEGNWNACLIALKGRMLSKSLKAVYNTGIQPAAMLTITASADDDQRPATTPTSPSSTNTPEQDGYALGNLLTCCSETQQQYFADAKTYVEARCALAEHHEPKTRVDRLATLSEYFNMKWNTKQESLPQFLELYEIVLQKLRASGYAAHDSMVVDQLLDMLPWQIRPVTHQVDSLPRGQGNNLATVRIILECEYKAPVRFGALTNTRSGNNDERALTAREQPNKMDSDDAQQDAVVFHTFDFQGQVLMDSGASSHMTGDATNLTDVQAYQHAVVVANGARNQDGYDARKRQRRGNACHADMLPIDNMSSTLLSVTAEPTAISHSPSTP